MKTIDNMIGDLMDMVEVKDDWKVDFSTEAKKLIHEIAEQCSEIEMVQQTSEQAEKYGDGLSAEQVYADMIVKIVNAPTGLHMRMAARMLIVVIDKKLKERGD
ncbi:MAG: hypothetical protein LUH14_10255 [Clostridiaceae bacterium]|nr:hypothetical protein [Clostridiaceae bacterium]